MLVFVGMNSLKIVLSDILRYVVCGSDPRANWQSLIFTIQAWYDFAGLCFLLFCIIAYCWNFLLSVLYCF